MSFTFQDDDSIYEDLDPFDVRMDFINRLKKLSASEVSRGRVVKCGLRYKRYYEDLYECIREDLEKSTNPSHRLNIFNSLSELILTSFTRDSFPGYALLTAADLPKIIELVCPEDTMGNVNVKVVKSLLVGWWKHKVMEEMVLVGEIEKLERRELKVQSKPPSPGLILSTSLPDVTSTKTSSPSSAQSGSSIPPNQLATSYPQVNSQFHSQKRSHSSTHGSSHSHTHGHGHHAKDKDEGTLVNGNGYSREAIIRRMDEDRERHKRIREESWIRPLDESIDQRFEFLWDSTEEWSEADAAIAKEENSKWSSSYGINMGCEGGDGTSVDLKDVEKGSITDEQVRLKETEKSSVERRRAVGEDGAEYTEKMNRSSWDVEM